MSRSVWVCGHCGKDYVSDRNRNEIMRKVILAGYANILCSSCHNMLKDEICHIAKTYLLGHVMSEHAGIVSGEVNYDLSEC